MLPRHCKIIPVFFIAIVLLFYIAQVSITSSLATSIILFELVLLIIASGCLITLILSAKYCKWLYQYAVDDIHSVNYLFQIKNYLKNSMICFMATIQFTMWFMAVSIPDKNSVLVNDFGYFGIHNIFIDINLMIVSIILGLVAVSLFFITFVFVIFFNIYMWNGLGQKRHGD